MILNPSILGQQKNPLSLGNTPSPTGSIGCDQQEPLERCTVSLVSLSQASGEL